MSNETDNGIRKFASKIEKARRHDSFYVCNEKDFSFRILAKYDQESISKSQEKISMNDRKYLNSVFDSSLTRQVSWCDFGKFRIIINSSIVLKIGLS